MNIIVKTPQGEMDLEFYCQKQYKRINLIMKMIEERFEVSLSTDCPELRHEILTISNFTRRLPLMINEVIK